MKIHRKWNALLLLKSCLLVSSLVGVVHAEDTIWAGANGVGSVSSGGYWFGYADSYHDGKSTTNFPTGSATIDSAGIWATKNGGIFDVNFNINPSPTLDWPYVGIGFDWSPQSGTAVPQTWKSVCLEYSFTGAVPLRFQIKDAYSFTKDNDYFVTLAKHPDMTKVCFALSDFTQNPGDGKQTIEDCMANSIGMQFIGVMARPATPLVSNLKLKSVTTSNDAKASRISPRVLSLREAGSSRIEVYNTKGTLVQQGIVGTQGKMSLGALPAGIYIAHIQNQSQRYTQRIAVH